MECNIPQKWNIFSIIPFTSMPAWIIQKPPPVRATTRLRMPSVTDRLRGDGELPWVVERRPKCRAADED